MSNGDSSESPLTTCRFADRGPEPLGVNVIENVVLPPASTETAVAVVLIEKSEAFVPSTVMFPTLNEASPGFRIVNILGVTDEVTVSLPQVDG
jgi:hypothetical protein